MAEESGNTLDLCAVDLVGLLVLGLTVGRVGDEDVVGGGDGLAGVDEGTLGDCCRSGCAVIGIEIYITGLGPEVVT